MSDPQRYTRWVTVFDGGKVVEAYQQFSDNLYNWTPPWREAPPDSAGVGASSDAGKEGAPRSPLGSGSPGRAVQTAPSVAPADDASAVPPGRDPFQWRYSTEANRMVRPRRRDDGVLTRIDVGWMTKAEEAIVDAMHAVETEGASEALTRAVMLLSEARERVADHAEGVEWKPADKAREDA